MTCFVRFTHHSWVTKRYCKNILHRWKFHFLAAPFEVPHPLEAPLRYAADGSIKRDGPDSGVKHSLCPVVESAELVVVCSWTQSSDVDKRLCRSGAFHKVRHASLDQFLPSSPCHTLSHISGPPLKYVTHLEPQCLVVGLHAYIHMSLQRFVLVRGVFDREFCPISLFWRINPGRFLSVPPSVTIHPLQQKAKRHFQF